MDKLQTAILAARAVPQRPLLLPGSPAVARAVHQPHETILPGLAPWRDCAQITTEPKPRPISINKIIAHIAAKFDMTPEQIRGGYRKHRFTFARHVAEYLASRLTEQSLPCIGRVFYRDHTSVLHGCRRVKDLMEKNPQTRALVERLENELREITT
jgi:hypothetical protein